MKTSKTMWMSVMMLALVALTFGGGFMNTASAAPAPVGDGTSLGGRISGQDGYPNLYSSATVNNETVTGSFNITLDASQFSLASANWSFKTDYWDPSQWTAACYMYGFRNTSEGWPRYQYWNQQVSPSAGPSISAGLGFESYETPNDTDLLNLQILILHLQLQLQTAPADQHDQLIAQISAVMAQLANLRAQPRKDVLQVWGDINIKPSSVTSSSFSYTEYEETAWIWSDEADEWVLGDSIPAWRAEFEMHGHFVADTLSEAQAMGAQFVPEPATMAILAFGGIATLMRRRNK